MLNPRVGEIVSMSSPLNFFKIVVFPALSRPLIYALRHENQLHMPVPGKLLNVGAATLMQPSEYVKVK